MAKGMSPLRLFMRNAPRKTVPDSIDGSSSGLDDPGAGQARQPFCPIPEAARNPLAPVCEQSIGDPPTPRGKSGQQNPRVRGKNSCHGQEKFPHLENSEDNVNFINATPDKNVITSASSAVAPSNAKNKFTWQHRQGSTAQNNARDGPPDVSTPPRPSKQALSDVGQGAVSCGKPSGTQQSLSSNSRGASNGGGSVPSTPKSVRAVGARPTSESESGGSLSQNTTPSKSVSRSLKYGQQASSCNSGTSGLTSGRSTVSQHVITRPMGYLQAVKGVLPQSVNQYFAQQHFELEEDASFWRDHNVQVLIRTRPISNSELSAQGLNRCLKQESPHTLSWLGQPESRFTFDHVAGETITQEKLFDVAGLPMVENCMSGYNSCMFAYGQTGSGKTHTMLGDIEDLDSSPSENRGMTPRVFEYLFGRIQMEQEGRRQDHLKFFCKCSFLEIYNEQITDLLEPSSTNLQMREDAKKGVYVENLSEVEVQGVQDVIQLLLQGAANRKVAATNMNRESSRSHSVFTCVVESKWETNSNSMTNSRYGRLHLVDLAGSERQKSSGAEGGRLKEAANINKSLSTLGLVIMILVDVANGKQRHVPYRDSKLTFLLQDSLGGNSKTIMIANVSPSSCCAMETLSTLKFAQRAKFIRNNAVINEDASGDVIALRHRIEELKVEVDRLRRESISRTPSLRYPALQDGSVVGESGDKLDASSLDCAEIGRSSPDSINTSQSKTYSNVNKDKKSRSLEEVLAGALRREQTAEDIAKKLAAEIEQLNRLVRQREEDSQCSKMMLRFREEKIRRLECIADNVLSVDIFYEDERKCLMDELQLIRGRLDRNPELTRFAMENIRLLEQLRRYQEFYDCGERDILLDEISGLRNQLLDSLDRKLGDEVSLGNLSTPQKRALVPEISELTRENELLLIEVESYQKELKECRNNLNSCLLGNADMARQIDDLQAILNQFQTERSQKQNSKDEDLCEVDETAQAHEQLEDALHESENLRGKIQETACSAKATVKQIRMETEELALEHKQSLTDIEEAALIWRKQELELRKQLKEAEDQIQKLLGQVGDASSTSQLNQGVSGLPEDDAVGRQGVQDRWEKLQEIEMRHSEEIMQLQLELESVEDVLKEERQQRLGAEQKSEDVSTQLSAALSQLEQAQSLVEALEGQQLFSINELENLQGEHTKILASLKQHEDEERLPQDVSHEKNILDDPAVLILEQKLQRAKRGKEEARKMNKKFQEEKASRMALDEEREMTMSEVETQAALAITTLQSVNLDLMEEVSAAAESEAKAKLEILHLTKEVEALQHTVDQLDGHNRHFSEKCEKSEILLSEKDAQLRGLEAEWKIATSKLMDYLADGDLVLTEVANEMDGIIDESHASSQRFWLDQNLSQLEDKDNVVEKREAAESMYHRLQDVQELAKETEGKVRALSAATYILGPQAVSGNLEGHALGSKDGGDIIRESEKKCMAAFLMVGQLLEKLRDLEAAKHRLVKENEEALESKEIALAALQQDLGLNRVEYKEICDRHHTVMEAHEKLQEEHMRFLEEKVLSAEDGDRIIRLSERKAMAAFVMQEQLVNNKEELMAENVKLEKEIQEAHLGIMQRDTEIISLQQQLEQDGHKCMAIADRHQLLMDGQKRLQEEHERLQVEHERLQVEHERLQVEHERLQVEHERLQVEHERLQVEHERLQVEHERLQVENERLQEEHNQMLGDNSLMIEDGERMIKLSERKAMAAFVMVDQLVANKKELKAENVSLQQEILEAHKDERQRETVVVVLQEQLEKDGQQYAEIVNRHQLLLDSHQRLQVDHGRSQDEHKHILADNVLIIEEGERMIRLSERKAMAAFVMLEQLVKNKRELKEANVRLEQEIEEIHIDITQKARELATLQHQLEQDGQKYAEIAERYQLLMDTQNILQEEHERSRDELERLLRNNALIVEDGERMIRQSERKAMGAFVMLEQLMENGKELMAAYVTLEKEIQDAHLDEAQKQSVIVALQQELEGHGEKCIEIADRYRLVIDGQKVLEEEHKRLEEEHERLKEEHGRLQDEHERSLGDTALIVADAERMIRLSERKAFAAIVTLEQLLDKTKETNAANVMLEKEIQAGQIARMQEDAVHVSLQHQLQQEVRKYTEIADRHQLLMDTLERLQEELEKLRGENALIVEDEECKIRLSERKALAAFVIVEQLMDNTKTSKAGNERQEKEFEAAAIAHAQRDTVLAELQQQLEQHHHQYMEITGEHQLLIDAHQRLQGERERLQEEHERLLRDNRMIIEDGERMIKLSEKKAMSSLILVDHLMKTIKEQKETEKKMEAEIKEYRLVLSEKDAGLAAFHCQFEVYDSEHKEFCDEYRSLVEKYDSLQVEHESCVGMNDNLGLKVEILGLDLSRSTDRENDLHDKLVTAEKQLTEVETMARKSVIKAFSVHDVAFADTDQIITGVLEKVDILLREVSEVEATEDHLNSVEDELSAGLSKVIQFEEENATARGVKESLQSTICRLTSTVNLQERELEIARQERDDCLMALEKEVACSQNWAQERSSLTSEKEQSRSDSLEQDKVVQALRLEVQRLESSLQQAELKISEMLKGMQALTVAKEEFELERNRLVISAHQAEINCSVKEQELVAIQYDLAGLQGRLSDAELCEQSISRQIEQLTVAKRELEMEKAGVEREIHAMKEEKDNLRCDIKYLNSEVGKSETFIFESFRRSQQALEEVGARMTAMDHGLAELEVSKGILEHDMTLLESAASSHLVALEVNEHEYAEMQRSVGRADLHITQMQTTIDSAAAKFCLEKNTWDEDKRKTLADKDVREKELRDEIASAELKLVATEQSLKIAVENVEALDLKKTDLDKEIVRLNEDAAMSLSKATQQQEEIEALKDGLRALKLESALADTNILTLTELREQYSLAEMSWRSEQELLMRRLKELEVSSGGRDEAVSKAPSVGSGAGGVSSQCLPNLTLATDGEKPLEGPRQLHKLDNEALRAKIREKDMTILSARKEMEIAIANLKEAELEMDKVHREKQRLTENDRENNHLIDSISLQLKAAEEELLNRDIKIERCEAELQKVAVMLSDWDIRMHDVESEWRREKEVLAQELTEARLDATEKRSEAAVLLQKFQDGQATLKEAEGLLDALVRANENAKHHAQDWKSEKESLDIAQGWWMPERDRLISIISSLEADIHKQKHDLWMICKDAVIGLVETMDIVTLAHQEIFRVKNDHEQEMEHLLREMESLKDDLAAGMKIPGDLKLDLGTFFTLCRNETEQNIEVGVEVLCSQSTQVEQDLGFVKDQPAEIMQGEGKVMNLELSDAEKNLRIQLKSSYMKVAALEDELKVRIKEFQLLEERLIAVEEGIAQRFSNMTESVLQLTSEKDSALRTNENLRVDITNLEAELLRIGDEFQAELWLRIEAVSNMESVLELQRQEIAEHEERLDVSETEVAQLHKMLQDNKISNAEKDDAVNSKALDSRNPSDLTLQFAELQGTLCLVQRELEDKTTAVGDLDKKLRFARAESDELGVQLQEAKIARDAALLGNYKLEGHTKNVEHSYAACVNDLSTLKRTLSAELLDFDQIRIELKHLTEDIEYVKLQTAVILEDELQADHDKISNIGCQMVALREDVQDLQKLSVALEVDGSHKQDAVQTLLEELWLDKNQMAAHAGNQLVTVNHLENERTVIFNQLAKLLKKFEAVSAGSVSDTEVLRKTESDYRGADVLLVQFDAVDAGIDQVLHENIGMKRQIQTLQPQLGALELEVDEYKVHLKDLKDKRVFQNDQFDQFLHFQQQELDTHKTLMSTLAFCSTLVSDMPDFSFQCEELRLLQNASHLKQKFGCDFVQMKEDIVKFHQAAQEEHDGRRLHTSVMEDENKMLMSDLKASQLRNSALEDELDEKRHSMDDLAEELMLEEERVACSLQMINSQLKTVECDRDKLQTEVVVLNEQLEMAQNLADERDIVAAEARQVAELSKSQAEEKEEEARILGRSVEELESTVYALESQLGIVKREAERQRVAREVLEKELEVVKQQMVLMQATIDRQEAQTARDLQDAETAKTELDRIVIEMKNQQIQARSSVESLQQECAEKDVQLRSSKAHIAELMSGAEKQAFENQQKLKTLECMVEQLKVADRKTNPVGSSGGKTVEKMTTSKVKGAGSPFKCIGSGLAQQRTSEMDEELLAAKRRIKELEVVAASRQKEVFMLNTKLAEAESMTHDVVRDLLGVKMDIASYATLLNQQQVQRIAERARRRTVEAQEKDEELDTLRNRLNEFIEERESWLEEINRRQAEAVAARVSAEKLRLRDQTLTGENERFKEECSALRKKATDLEEEITKLSGQQNLQQRIHHHAKIKEENNSFRLQNDDLSGKLRRMEILFTRVNDELARYRTAEGKSAFLNFDEEDRLQKKLQETEENRLQLAQSLIGLCTCIMQAAGIQRTSKVLEPSAAMSALQQLQDRQEALERELSDYQLKERIAGEKRRLSDLRDFHTPVKTISTNFTASQELPSPDSSSR